MNEIRDLKVGIIGFGKMGKIRYETLKSFPNCRVTRIFEKNPDIALPEDVQHAKSPHDILEDAAVDVVVIATSNDMLQELVVAGLNKGKHVFCEKPPGRNVAELQEMINAEKTNPQLKLMFGFNHRHHESVIHTKSLIDSGKYGNVLWLRGRYGKSCDEKFFSNWRAQKKLAGGGIFLDQGIHMLDLFLMLCDDFEEVKSFVSNLYWKLDIEDNVFAIFKNKKGQVASLHSTMTQWRHLFSLEIFLERGYITINGLKTSSNTYGDEEITIALNRSDPPAAMWTDEENILFHIDSSWKREFDIFFSSIRNNQPIPVGNTRDALKLMKLVEQVYSQA